MLVVAVKIDTQVDARVIKQANRRSSRASDWRRSLTAVPPTAKSKIKNQKS